MQSMLFDLIPFETKSLKIENYQPLERGYDINTPEYCNLESSIQSIGFFSGAGGLDIGSVLSGVKVISCLDFDKDSIKTLSNNSVFSKTEHRHENIMNANASDYDLVIKHNKPEKLILIGGPPCQPFSKAGYWVGNKNRLANDDPRNMIYQYLRIVEELQPNGFLLENVESILHPTNRIAVENLSEEINKLGYKFKVIRANALDYGVPQKRKRVFFIASKKGFKTNEPIKTHGNEFECLVNANLTPHEKVIDWIHLYDDNKFFEKEEIALRGTYGQDLLEVPPGKNYISLTAHAGYENPKFVAQKRFWSFLLKLDPFEPSWTIAAQPGPWVGPFHWNSRRLRVPEIAAIQTFPKDYHFVGSRRSIQKQIGNAVPPLLGKAIIDFLITNI
jgi:DNA (cytosine-5)-methyltransferase 1